MCLRIGRKDALKKNLDGYYSRKALSHPQEAEKLKAAVMAMLDLFPDGALLQVDAACYLETSAGYAKIHVQTLNPEILV